MPTSKVIRPAVFDETGEHVIPADADLNLDPVSSDPDNYVVRGSDGGAFLNGDGVLSNDGENLLKTAPNDGKVTYPRSDAVDLIRDTMQAALDIADERINNAQDAADKAQATADRAAEYAADAQCTATQALNEAADAQADADKAQDAADKAQASADQAKEDAAAAQCAAGQALDKAQEAIDKLPEIAAEHATIVTAGDGIKVDQSKLGDHNVYQVSVKRNGEDSGLISSTDGLEVELKGNGGIDKDKDGLYVDQQWIDEMVARYAKDHMLFNQFKIVKQLPEIPDADVHTLYLIRNRDSSATDAGTKDSFDGWFIATTENGTQKWEEVGYKTDLRGYTHAGNTVTITGYVSGTGTVDSNGNVTVDVVPNIADTPSTWYVGKTNARDYWGKDENGNMWGSTKDHPFASLGFAINQSNRHVFSGNSVQVWISESGEYRDFSSKWSICMLSVTTETHVLQLDGVQAEIRTAYDINISNAASLHFHGITFRRCHIDSKSEAPDGVTFFRIYGGGLVVFYNGCRMITDSNNDDCNTWPFVESDVSLRFASSRGKPGLTLELAGTGTVQYASFIELGNNSSFGAPIADTDCPFLKIIAPNGTQARSCVFNTGRFCVAESYSTAYPNYRQYVDWDIADESKLVQVALGGYAYFGLRKNPDKGQALPGHEVGTVPAGAVYRQVDY